MTLSEFNSQSLSERTNAVMEWGFYVGNRKQEVVNTVLFSLNSFFVEMLIRVSDNEVIDIRAFTRSSVAPWTRIVGSDNVFFA